MNPSQELIDKVKEEVIRMNPETTSEAKSCFMYVWKLVDEGKFPRTDTPSNS